MKWWQWLLVFGLVIACVLGITLGIVLTKKSGPETSPVPSTSIFPFPSLTISPQNRELILLYDTFDGVVNTPLPQHIPNAPVGIFWVPYQVSPDAYLELNGSGAASNLVDISTNPDSLIYTGANITSGKFTNLGYRPKTDTLVAETVVEIPTITPRPDQNEQLLVIFALSRTTPQNDMLTWAFDYRIGKNLSNPPSWKFTSTTLFDVNGLNAKTKTIIDTGYVSGDPPLNTPLRMTFSINPNGLCVVTCPELNINTQGPILPDIVPKDGFAMHSLSMIVLAGQASSTSAQPLYVKISEVRVSANYQITEASAEKVEALEIKGSERDVPVREMPSLTTLLTLM